MPQPAPDPTRPASRPGHSPAIASSDQGEGTSRVSLRANGGQGNDLSGGPFNAISADGRFVAFFSVASNLVPGDTNETGDVFVRDRE